MGPPSASTFARDGKDAHCTPMGVASAHLAELWHRYDAHGSPALNCQTVLPLATSMTVTVDLSGLAVKAVLPSLLSAKLKKGMVVGITFCFVIVSVSAFTIWSH